MGKPLMKGDYVDYFGDFCPSKKNCRILAVRVNNSGTTEYLIEHERGFQPTFPWFIKLYKVNPEKRYIWARVNELIKA